MSMTRVGAIPQHVVKDAGISPNAILSAALEVGLRCEVIPSISSNDVELWVPDSDLEALAERRRGLVGGGGVVFTVRGLRLNYSIAVPLPMGFGRYPVDPPTAPAPVTKPRSKKLLLL